MRRTGSIPQAGLVLSLGLWLAHFAGKNGAHSFVPIATGKEKRGCELSAAFCLKMSLGAYTIDLEKPLGMILEERDGSKGGVKVQTLLKPPEETPGSAWKTGKIAPGDVLMEINGVDVSSESFETIMDMLVEGTSTPTLKLEDGLGTFDMPKNVLKRLSSTEDAYLVDAVVRQAVREIRRDGRLGDVLQVEVIVGAGVNEDGMAMVRFFAIFSTDGSTTYSCNVSAKGIEETNESISDKKIRIVSLSCAKDEGLGRTYDLIQE